MIVERVMDGFNDFLDRWVAGTKETSYYKTDGQCQWLELMTLWYSLPRCIEKILALDAKREGRKVERVVWQYAPGGTLKKIAARRFC